MVVITDRCNAIDPAQPVALRINNKCSSINIVFTAETHDCMEKVRPGSGRETGLGHAGGRAPKVGAPSDAWSSCRNDAEKFFTDNTQQLCDLCVVAVSFFYGWP